MLDVRFVIENSDLVIRKTEARGLDINLDDFIKLYQQRKKYLKKIEDLRFERNKSSQLIGQLKKEGRDTSSHISEMKKVSEEIKKLDVEFNKIDENLKKILLVIPNIAHESVPEGQSPKDNVEVRRFGEKPNFRF